MRINGITITNRRIVEVYLPIVGGKAVCFKFRSLGPEESFEKIIPHPKARQVLKPGGKKELMTAEPAYKKRLETWARQKLDWEFLTSVSETEGLEWATVDMAKPETYENWEKDLLAIFSQSEVDKIFRGFVEAQHIDEKVMEKAREDFLIGTLEQGEILLLPMDEQPSTPSTEPVNALESVPLT